MLQQILENMYIDPELLERLDDDERLHLFGKMREEQVRRWKQWQEQLEREEGVRRKPKLPPKPGRKKVHFMLGSDGNPWTWVIDDVDAYVEGAGQQRDDRFSESGVLSNEVSTQQNAECVGAVRRSQEEEEDEEAEDREVRATLSRAQLLAHILEQNNTDNEKMNWLKRKQDKLKKKQVPPTDDVTDIADIPEVDRAYALLHNTQQKAENMQNTIRKSIESKEEETKLTSKDNETNDNQITEIARRARVLIKAKSLMADKNERNNHVSNISRSSMLTVTRTRDRPGKPPSRAAIIEWFRLEEKPRGSGWDSDSNCIAPWFHGMVSRQEAQELLLSQPKGTFLVRFCERICGYVVSYRAADKCKHYVIDASNNHYQFLGEGFQRFNKLGDLIRYYQSRSFVPNDGDRLIRPCPKCNNEQMFNELFA